MPICKSCALLPQRIRRTGYIHIAVPSLKTEEAVSALLAENGADCQPTGEGLLTAVLSERLLEGIIAGLPSLMPDHELEEARILVSEAPDQLTPLHVLRMEKAKDFIERLKGEWLVDVLEREALTTHFHPIVSMESHDIFGYECLTRGILPAGELVQPGKLFYTAGQMGLMFHLDRLSRISAIRNAARAGIKSKIFVNFNPTSIYQPEACLQTTVAAVQESGLSSSDIVFEVVESEEVRDTAFLLRILDFYRNAGFKVALDDLGAGYSGLNLLSELKPDVIKLDMHLVRGVHHDPYKAQIARHILELANSLGVQSVVEGIEVSEEWQWAKDNGATYGQGFFFAKPGPIPASAPENEYFAIRAA